MAAGPSPSPIAGSWPRKAGRPAGTTSLPARSARRVHLGHFAFMRAVILGIGMRESWTRYLRVEGEFSDTRTVKRTIRWLREEFELASRKASRHGAARLMLVDVQELPPLGKALPSLDDWAAENGWDGFGESEILRAYTEAHQGVSPKVMQRSRLIDKQLATLRWLEPLLAQRPHPGDPCRVWFTTAIADHLASASLLTLAQLLEQINGIGRHWWRSVPAIGQGKARLLQEWLHEHEASLGASVGSHVAIARSKLFGNEMTAIVPKATAIRPLEKFVVPAELDGRAGRYRQPKQQCLLSADNDYEAILAWLKAKHSLSPEAVRDLRGRQRRRDREIDPSGMDPLAWLQTLSHTQRAYRKEAERFLLWSILERGKALSSISTEDCAAYREFLADPQPAELWCGSGSRERWSPLWRPFKKGLSTAAQRYSVTVLKNLYGFLADQNYLMGNPWVGISMPRNSRPGLNASRSFTERQWAFIEDQLTQLPKSEGTDRLVFAISLLYSTGLRLSEAVAAKVGDLKWVEYLPGRGQSHPTVGWELMVEGKGGKLRDVIVPQKVVDMLKAYLALRGLGTDLNSVRLQSAHLLGPIANRSDIAVRLQGSDAKVEPGQGIGPATLYRLLKEFFAECGGVLAGRDAESSARFEKASTHWLRHTHASHSIARGVPLEVAQANLGHASLATTTVYVTTEKERRMRAMQESWR